MQTRSDKIIPITEHQIYGSMLSEVLKLIFAGKSSEILAFLLNYIKTHYLDKLFPPAPVNEAGHSRPSGAMGSPAATENAFKSKLVQMCDDHAPSRKAMVGAALSVPFVIDYIISILKGIVADYAPEVELQIVNYALSVVVPAIRAQGMPFIMVANIVETILLKIKEGLEQHVAKAA